MPNLEHAVVVITCCSFAIDIDIDTDIDKDIDIDEAKFPVLSAPLWRSLLPKPDHRK